MFFFLIGLVVPLAILLWLSLRKVGDKAFLQQRFLAEQTSTAIEKRVADLLDAEEQRPFDHYSFYTVAKSELSEQQGFSRSPLSDLSRRPDLPGLVGYFQIEPDGRVSSPILPLGWSTANQPVDLSEAGQRETKFKEIERILSNSVALSKRTKYQQNASEPDAKINQEALLSREEGQSEGKKDLAANYKHRSIVEKMNVQQQRDLVSAGEVGRNLYKSKVSRKEAANIVGLDERSEKSWEDQKEASLDLSSAVEERSGKQYSAAPKVVSFEAEVDPIQGLTLREGYLIFFRKAWRGEKRIIQGALVQTRDFFETLLQEELDKSALPPATNVLLSFQDEPFLRLTTASYSLSESYSRRNALKAAVSWGKDIPSNETLLFKSSLPLPLQSYNLYISVAELPLPPGSSLVILLGVVFVIFLFTGSVLLYRLANGQIEYAQQRNDFVSAVSHEFKTPLTSIRMYGEMLRNDWVSDDQKKRSYYDYIFHESERLSRLIANVLRLSRITNNHDVLALHSVDSNSILQELKGKLTQTIESSEFVANFMMDAGARGNVIAIDDDAMSQIAINLVDNALKFSREADRKEIEVGFRFVESSQETIFFVRDFGPGVAKAEQRKIFELFYRSGAEITRKTIGTGIGLALVRELAESMGARINYRSREPGAEFQVIFKQ